MIKLKHSYLLCYPFLVDLWCKSPPCTYSIQFLSKYKIPGFIFLTFFMFLLISVHPLK